MVRIAKGQKRNGLYLYRSRFGPEPKTGASIYHVFRRGRGEVIAAKLPASPDAHRSGYLPITRFKGTFRGPLTRTQRAALGL